MTSIRITGLRVVAVASILLVVRLANAEIVGVNGLGELYVIDEATGAGTQVAQVASNFGHPGSMAMDASGTLHSIKFERLPIAADYLFAISRTGSSWTTATGPQTISNVRALAFSPVGTLFGIRGNDVTGGDLYTIDLDTGAGTFIGSTILPGVQALDFSADGTLYGYAVGEGSGTGVGLVTIDPVSGVATHVDPAVDGSGWDVQTIAFAPDGTLYGARTDLFTIDVDSGALTLVGPIGVDEFSGMGGMVWIPEPSTLTALLTLAAPGLLVHLRRRRRKHGC